jgi:hypothetical protein
MAALSRIILRRGVTALRLWPPSSHGLDARGKLSRHSDVGAKRKSGGGNWRLTGWVEGVAPQARVYKLLREQFDFSAPQSRSSLRANVPSVPDGQEPQSAAMT